VDEVREFCRRVLGDGPAVEFALRSVDGDATPALASHDRIARLAAAARACRTRANGRVAGSLLDERHENGATERGLAVTVARELAQATGRLPERQREVLALRELLRLSYGQIATVMGVEATAVPLLLARARLRFRAERRGTPIEQRYSCTDRERALRGLVRRQDSEPLTAADDSWLIGHLRECEECCQAHGAMLEASACYRAGARAGG
jgi:hypothetical protein